ncbi:PstS family phosphate ABC transporter substrate-binding protein [Hymenobacter sp. B81]|uniref:PstS family phosphate ABC transporter substrate-binding protein n=1 Tax=Hymenobacter sp. B81 TaxID=3344878 RepID=UPI0037DDD4C5
MNVLRVNRLLLGFGVVCSLATGASLLSGCGNGSGPGAVALDTPTSGSIRISVDATFEPILKSHVDTFEKIYTAAKIRTAYKPEQDVMRDLLNDSVRAVVVARQLTDEERGYFDRLKIVPRTAHVATDGLAVLVNPANPDTMLTMGQLRDIFTGRKTQWSQVSGKAGKLGAISVVFDQNRSSTARYVQDSVTRGAALAKEVFASESNPKLIEYVASHPNAIGVIGVNWISDMDDAQAQSFRRQVRVVGVSRSESPASADDYVQPYQAYLATKAYPLRRNVYIVSREARAGLGTGFASFVAGNQGQLIFLKAGLMPATGQVRLIQANP